MHPWSCLTFNTSTFYALYINSISHILLYCCFTKHNATNSRFSRYDDTKDIPINTLIQRSHDGVAAFPYPRLRLPPPPLPYTTGDIEFVRTELISSSVSSWLLFYEQRISESLLKWICLHSAPNQCHVTVYFILANRSWNESIEKIELEDLEYFLLFHVSSTRRVDW